MKNIRILLTLFLACPALAQQEPVAKVYATGVARILVTPDTLTWSLTIASKKPTSAAASKQVSTTVATVVAFLEGVGIPRNKMQVSSISFSEHSKKDSKRERFDGYMAVADMEFELTDLDRREEILSKLSSFTEVTVDFTEWSYSKQTEVLEQARDDAARSAKRKAERMASVLGAKIGGPIFIADAGSSIGSSFRDSGSLSTINTTRNYRSDEDADDDDNQGRIPIKAKVVVHFELIREEQPNQALQTTPVTRSEI